MLQGDELFGMRVRQWLQDDAVDDAENGGVGTDPKRQGQHRCDRERGLLPQHACGVSHVLPGIIQQAEPLLVAYSFRHHVVCPELEACPPPGFVEWPSSAEVLLGQQRQVLRQFLTEAVVVLTPKQ